MLHALLAYLSHFFYFYTEAGGYGGIDVQGTVKKEEGGKWVRLK